jgi:probable rRNA maturation factor
LRPTQHQIEIADQQTHPFDAPALLSAIREILIDHEVKSSEISLAVVDDPTIRTLNKRYLQHDYETDVISFVLDWDEPAAHLAGQLIVSTDTAAREGQQLGSSMQEELLLYVIHGSLHLVGYDDKTEPDALAMREAERDYLNRRGIEHRGFLPPTHSEDRWC